MLLGWKQEQTTSITLSQNDGWAGGIYVKAFIKAWCTVIQTKIHAIKIYLTYRQLMQYAYG
jgi:hypothetical protein